MNAWRTMRSRLAFLLCVILVLPLVIVFTAFASSETEKDSLIVGVPVDRCPVFYVEPHSGEIAGIGIDLMKAAAEEAGYAVTFRALDEETLKEALDNEKYDLIMPFGSAISSASGRQSVVSENLLMTPFTLVTRGNRNLPELESENRCGPHAGPGPCGREKGT